jgi:hypothetical protein
VKDDIPLTPYEKELYFCLNRMEQYWITLNEKSLKRKLSNKLLEKYLSKIYEWEDQTDLKLLRRNPKIQK